MNKYIVGENKIEFLDSRFYKIGEDYLPSVTTITSNYPKGSYFEAWLKDKGAEADQIRDESADIGSNVHKAIELLLQGSEIDHNNYLIPEWELIHKAKDFFDNHKFTNIQAEQNFVSKELGFGGTVDFLGRYKDENWLIDFKTSNAVQRSSELQVYAYKLLVEKMTGIKIDRVGILHLKASTRTVKEFQGNGYALREVATDDYIGKVFMATKTIFEDHMKGLKPRILNYPLKMKLI